MAQDIVGFDQATAARVLKAVRAVESSWIQTEESRSKPSFSIVQVVVPRSGPDGSGFYTGDLCSYDAGSDTFTLVNNDIRIKPLPATL